MRGHAVIRAAAVLLAMGPGWLQAQTTGDSAVLTLTSLVERAQATHPLTLSARAEGERAAAVASEVRSTRYPRLSIEGAGTRHQEPMIVAPLHGFDPSAPPEFDRTLLQGRAGASLLLFDGGARGSRIARSEAGVDAAAAGAEQTGATLIERVVRAYIGVRSARELLAAHRAQIDALEAERTRAERMLQAGSVPRVAVLRAEAALSRARAEEAARQTGLHRLETDLARLTDTGLDTIRSAAFEAIRPLNAALPDRPGSIEAAQRSNPGVARARAQLAASEAGVREAKAAYWPTLSLVGGYNDFNSAAGNNVAEWQTGLQVSWAVFTAGARGAAVRRAGAESEIARQAVRQAELDVATQVDYALGDLEMARARVVALRSAVEQFSAVVDVETLSLSAGAGVQTDYLRAVSDLLEARASLTQAEATEIEARLALARSTGELTVEWLGQNLEASR
jgi:outer membrane protein TolC